MSNRFLASLGTFAALIAVASLAPIPFVVQAQTADAWTAPRTPWGDPDLQGIWDYRTITPLERPREFADTEFLTENEVAELERRRLERPDGRPPGDPRQTPSVHAPYWLDYGKKVVATKRSSLIVDPPNGRVPPLTPTGQQRVKAIAETRRRPAASWEDRNLWERCITRGLPRLPAGYNNNYQIFQTPGYVVIFNEMIHNTRIVPLDGRPHLPQNVRQWHGDSRGRWNGDTLVVETTNFSEKSNFRGAGRHLYLVELFKRVDAETIDYQFTVEDATTFTQPWTAAIPLNKIEGPLFEYACHEGNRGLENILSVARSRDKATPTGSR